MALSGADRRLLHSRVEEIVDFAELGDFINMPVKQYSLCMLVRLDFAVATSLGLAQLPARWQHQARPHLSEDVKAKNSGSINRADRETGKL